MNVLVLTNTFTPHVGGVARSVERFVAEYRRQGHRVLVVAPELGLAPEVEEGVVRVPALVGFTGGDFAVPVPMPGRVAAAVERFGPHVVHSHHPFLLGDTALRLAAARGLPVVFTHHTLYECYTHYVPGDSPRMRRFAIELAVGYCNLCDAVIAPSESVEGLLRERGVTAPIRVIPTGVDLAGFAAGDGTAFRAAHGIPADALVVGHVGRLAPEKNLGFLARAVARLLEARPGARFLVVGDGPARETVTEELVRRGLGERLHAVGVLGGAELVSAYRAMDVFAFASHSETQGMVLTEAMAAGVPVVAVDASGVREV
ncbi:MAG TPA: glycosyltransferase, partial [Thermoanaerobaculia bacterium]